MITKRIPKYSFFVSFSFKKRRERIIDNIQYDPTIGAATTELPDIA